MFRLSISLRCYNIITEVKGVTICPPVVGRWRGGPEAAGLSKLVCAKHSCFYIKHRCTHTSQQWLYQPAGILGQSSRKTSNKICIVICLGFSIIIYQYQSIPIIINTAFTDVVSCYRLLIMVTHYRVVTPDHYDLLQMHALKLLMKQTHCVNCMLNHVTSVNVILQLTQVIYFQI